MEPIKEISTELSPQMKAFIDFVQWQQKELQDWINKNVGIPADRRGEPQRPTPTTNKKY